MEDRLTGRTIDELEVLENSLASALTYNELLALAARRLEFRAQQVRNGMGNSDQQDVIDAGRDASLAFTELENAAMRYNSLVYRLKGSWKRVDADRT